MQVFRYAVNDIVTSSHVYHFIRQPCLLSPLKTIVVAARQIKDLAFLNLLPQGTNG